MKSERKGCVLQIRLSRCQLDLIRQYAAYEEDTVTAFILCRVLKAPYGWRPPKVEEPDPSELLFTDEPAPVITEPSESVMTRTAEQEAEEQYNAFMAEVAGEGVGQ